MRKSEKNGAQAADKTDLQILSLLRDDARMSVKHIAEKTYSFSDGRFSARIEKLERDGYIEGYHTRINPQAVRLQHQGVYQSGSRTRSEKGILSLYPFLSQRRGVQLRDGGLCHADRGAFPHDGRTRSFHQRVAAFRQDQDADRVFHLRRTPRFLPRSGIAYSRCFRRFPRFFAGVKSGRCFT